VIGTASPGSALTVSGDIEIVGGNRTLKNSSGFLQVGTTSNDYLAFLTNNGEKARIDTSGRLLVGTSSVSYGTRAVFQGHSGSATSQGIVHLQKGSANPSGVDQLGELKFSDSNGSIGAEIAAYNESAWATNDYPTRLVFSTCSDGASSPTERMRLTSGGLFKVQTQGASYESATAGVNELSGSVNDTLLLLRNTSGTINSSRGGIDILYSAANPNSTTASFLQCNSAGPTLRAEIRSNGGLANYSANNANLSDRNAKKDIGPAADTWNCIKEWEIVNYRYKDQPDDADLNLGVIAQQVAESCPEVITVFSEAKDAKPAVLDDDGNEVEPAQEAQPRKLGVKEQQMMWMAIKALQEAQVRIETLEAEVAALKAQ